MEETKQASLQVKDMLIPGSIVIAGALVAITIAFTGGLPDTSSSGVSSGTRVQGDLFQEIADGIGVDMDEFNTCVANKAYREKIQQSLQEGIALGVQGTPGSFVNGTEVRGAVSYEELQGMIDTALNGVQGPLSSKIEIVAGDHVRGSVSAPVTIVEYSDLQCPYCASFHPTLNRVLDEYKGKVRWVYRHYPLSFHPKAQPGAEAAECVWAQKGDEGFWKFIDQVFANQGRLEAL